MLVEHGPGYEVHHLPLPSGRCAVVRILTNYIPVALEIHELTGTNVLDIKPLALALLELASRLEHPEGITSTLLTSASQGTRVDYATRSGMVMTDVLGRNVDEIHSWISTYLQDFPPHLYGTFVAGKHEAEDGSMAYRICRFVEPVCEPANLPDHEAIINEPDHSPTDPTASQPHRSHNPKGHRSPGHPTAHSPPQPLDLRPRVLDHDPTVD